MNARRIPVVAAALAVLAMATSAGALSLGQVDTFEDGMTQGWVVALLGASSPFPPVNVASGGPAGDDDSYLQLQSGGGAGAGSRLTAINTTQWAGDYPAAGVTAIAMDVRSFTDGQLFLRLVLSDPSAGPPTNLAFSTTPIVVNPSLDWQSIVLPVTAGDMTAGLGTVAAALAGATELRIYHGTSASFPGEPVSALLEIDNIRAIPEAGTASLLALGLAGLARRGRRAV